MQSLFFLFNLKQEDVKRSLKVSRAKSMESLQNKVSPEDDWDSAQRKSLIHSSSMSRKRERKKPTGYY